MAQGDVFIFDSAIEYLLKGTGGVFNFGGTPDTVKVAIVNNATVPSTTTANPCWGAGGTTNFATNEQSGGNFTAGGKTCSSVTVSVVGGVPRLDFGDPTAWLKNAANPQSCYWGIIYDDTATNKNCLAYVDLGGVFDARNGDLTIVWGTPFLTADQ